MEKSSGNTKNMLISVAILIAILVAGYFYSTRDRSIDALLVGEPVGNGPIDTDLLSTLRELKGLRLDESIFSDPTFRSLVDEGRPLPPQTSGRPNPFAPIQSSASVFSATTTP